MPKIQVHKKALAHLSRGLYRSPASALRELVSNAWDANATRVMISMNYPQFVQISIQDNGDGFTRETFERLMGGGIGNSDKRQEDEEPLIHDRPLIGRLGIGLLGIAQICGNFEIASKPKTGQGFHARVHLYDLIKPKLDREDPSIVTEDDGNVREVDVGEYDFIDQPRSDIPHGTRITSDDVHPVFADSFQKSRASAPRFEEPPLKWAECLKIISKAHSLQELGDYWRLLWELSVACPLPYLRSNAIPKGAVTEIQARLESYEFDLRVDGISLAKPVDLRGNPAGYTVERIPLTFAKVYGRAVEYEGYIAVQEGSQLKPDELRGIMIRVKNIGIGYYDPRFLDYQWNQGPREKWVTGEIFVHKGLEDALNIDRDSFNKFHPEYRAVQSKVHEILKDKVFPQVYKQIDVRSHKKEQQRARARITGLRDVVASSLDTTVRVKTGQSKPEAIDVKTKHGGVDITFSDLSELDTKKAQRPLAAAILALYELAAQESGRDRQRARFRELLLGLLSRW